MIRFNCKHVNRFKHLSNEYGGVLFEFEGCRFLDGEIIDLFRRLETCDRTEFLDTLRWLQPEKRWTIRKELFWLDNGKPIRGVVASLLGAMTESTPTARSRRGIVALRLGLVEISINPPPNEQMRERIMYRAMCRKYENTYYRELLLKTGDAVLHQTPVVGPPDEWTWKDGKGGDKIGRMLMQIRNNVRMT
tara:strand:- start:2803 stop:3375 length:573 start_codon:yes stop_codon:yes gene_type:complete